MTMLKMHGTVGTAGNNEMVPSGVPWGFYHGYVAHTHVPHLQVSQCPSRELSSLLASITKATRALLIPADLDLTCCERILGVHYEL